MNGMFSSFAFTYTHCDACKARSHIALGSCSMCLSAGYCGITCQTAAWPLHKKECRAKGAAVLAALHIRSSSGDGAALADLGILHNRGMCRLEKSPQKAAAAWARGAAIGHAGCSALLSKLVSDGTIGVPPDPSAFVECPVPKPKTIALLDAGQACLDAEDYERALSIYESCAVGPPCVVTARGLAELSSIYRLGMGVPVDVARAAAYTRAAVDAAVAAHVKCEADADWYLCHNLVELAYDDGAHPPCLASCSVRRRTSPPPCPSCCSLAR